MKTKEELLSLNVFNDCNWLNLYVELTSMDNDYGYTEDHHIIPKCYFKKFNLPIDESTNNHVKLSYKNHLLAHYYLYKSCINKDLKIRLSLAVQMMLNIKVEDIDNHEDVYNLITSSDLEDIRLNWLYGLKHPSKETIERKSVSHIGKKHSLDTRLKQSNGLKGKKKSDLHKKHLSEAAKKRDNSNYKGRTGAKGGRNGSAKSIMCVETGEKFSYMEEVWCLKFNDKSRKPLKHAIENNEMYKGFHWKYINEE